MVIIQHKSHQKKYEFGKKEYTCQELQQIAWEKQGLLYSYLQLYARIKRLGVAEAVNGYKKRKKCVCGCGEEFYLISSLDRRKYHDKDRCRRRHLKNMIIRGELPPSKILTCELCGRKFPIWKQIGMHDEQRFCSDDCRSEHHAIMMRKGDKGNAYGKSSDIIFEGLDDKPRDYNLANI